MSWLPQNLASSCTSTTNLTTCQPSTYMFLQLVTSLFGQSSDRIFTQPINPETGYEQNMYRPIEPDASSVFDFIVIGAGSAGCVVANRLTEVPEWNVLLLEAGDEEPDVAGIPAFAAMLRRSTIDWSFMTQPQPESCTARPQGRCVWPRGMVMGGTSAINLMIYLRGGVRDYDEWAELGNHGWGFNDIFPYFIKTERNLNPDLVDLKYHGTTGEWPVEYFPYQDENIYVILKAFQQLGLDLFDQNGQRQVGGSLLQHSQANGQRVSANEAFINPIRNRRKNLRVSPRSFVTRILIDPVTKVAHGVEYTKNGDIYRAFATKEVIVSAGVMMSPKILMLSGVGPAEHLREMNIPIIKDLRVGDNLHDHATVDGVVFSLTNLTATSASDEQIQRDIDYYQKTNRGPISSVATLQLNAFVQTKYETEYDRPDIQFSLDNADIGNFLEDPILTALTNVLPLPYYNGIAIRPVLLNPKSRGFVRLNATHPVFGPPLIYANTFKENIDLLRMLDGIRLAIELTQTKALQEIGAELVTAPMPACQHYPYGTEEYWVCVCTAYTTTLYHPVGTCKMGPKSDKTAVVSPELKVYGIKGLRVVDGSVMPIVVRANTNTATLMIADKACDMIKKDWLYKKGKDLKPYIFIKKFFDLFKF